MLVFSQCERDCQALFSYADQNRQGRGHWWPALSSHWTDSWPYCPPSAAWFFTLMMWLRPLYSTASVLPEVAKSSRPLSYLTRSGQHLTWLITPCFLDDTSLAPLASCPPTSLAVPFRLLCRLLHLPMHSRVFQGSAVGSLGKPIHLDGFKDCEEFSVDVQPQHPS